MIVVEFQKNLKAYNGANSLVINTSFKCQNITQIFGPSGSGKTTLLKIIAGLIIPEKGKITVNNEVWLNTSNKFNLAIQKRNVGFVFQDYALFPNMTVEQHLHFVTKDVAFIHQLLNFGQLDHFKNHYPSQLSGGQKQRLAILRALAIKPKLLLMDEPFSALDKKLKSDLLPKLKTLIKELNITCLVVTHHPFEENGFVDEVFEMGE